MVNNRGCGLAEDELVMVVDADRYPTLKRQLINRVGYNDSQWFVCVQGVTNDHAGFYARPRFKRVDNVGEA